MSAAADRPGAEPAYPRALEGALPESPTTADVANLATSLRIRTDVLNELLEIPTADSEESVPLEVAAAVRLRRAAALADVALYVLRHHAAAGEWLTAPMLQLGRRTPLEAASTPEGLASASSMLWRIEFGIFG